MLRRTQILRIKHIEAINGWLKARPRRNGHHRPSIWLQLLRRMPLYGLCGSHGGETTRGRHCALPYWIEPLSNPSPLRVMSPADRKARIRPGTAIVAFGALVSVAIGGAYFAGSTAKATTVRAQAERIQGATAAGFTEEALAAAAGLDESALSIARRHDPYLVAGSDQRDRQAELLTARLEQLRSTQTGSGLRQVNLTGGNGPAQPFRLGGALEASRDLDCLTEAVYYEARGEGRDGMRAVAQVVLNRVRHPSYPKSVCGVVYQGSNRSSGCQFSFTCNREVLGRRNAAAWDRARTIASGALSGQVFGTVGNATHFHTTAVNPNWRNSLVRVAQVGDHLFYRFSGRAGSRAAFAYAGRPSTAADSAPRVVQANLNTAPAANDGPVVYSEVVATEAAPAAAPVAQRVSTSTSAPAEAVAVVVSPTA